MISFRFCFHAVPLTLAALACFGGLPAGAALLVTSATDSSTGQVLSYDERTGAFIGVFIDTFAGRLGGVYNGMVIGPDGNLYLSKSSGGFGEVPRHDVRTGAFLDYFIPQNGAGLTRPQALNFGPDGDLYLCKRVPAGAFDDSIVRYDGRTGAFLDVVVPPTGNPSNPKNFSDFVFGPDGNLYIANHNNILRYDGTTGAFLGFFANGDNTGGNFTGLVFGPDGNLYVSDTYSRNGPVERFDGTTGAFIDFFAKPGGERFLPSALIFGPDGDLYVCGTDPTQPFGHQEGSVERYDGSSGAFLGDFVLPGSGGLMNPTGLLFTLSSVVPEFGGTLTLLGAGLLALIGYSVLRRDPLNRIG